MLEVLKVAADHLLLKADDSADACLSPTPPVSEGPEVPLCGFSDDDIKAAPKVDPQDVDDTD